jgi:hypothetical protein
MANVSIRHAEPNDASAIHRILSGPRAIAGTMQLPLQSVHHGPHKVGRPSENLPSTHSGE